jgi:hypothetical protein
VCSVLQTVEEGFMFVCDAKATIQVEHGIVVIQWEIAKKFFQFLKSFADFGRITFVGFGVGLVQLVQDGVTITIAGIEGVGLYIGF